MENESEILTKAMELVGIGVLPMALKTIIELNVLEILSKSGSDSKLSASQIVTQLPTTNPNAAVTLDRILRLLASYSVLTSTTTPTGERLYGMSSMCKHLLTDQNGVPSFAALIVMLHDKILMETWHYLKDAVLTEGCIPFEKAFGVPAFDYFAKDARFSGVFNNGMYEHSTMCMRDVMEKYKGFQGLDEVIDVGGGTGASLKMIISEYPDIKGVNFDLPHVIADAPAVPGVKHVAGDMFDSIPAGSTIFMKWILHDWDDERCLKLLKNCWNALSEDGKVIIVEWILPTDIASDIVSRRVFCADLMMLAFNDGGKERTLGEYKALAKAAGFASVKHFPCSNGISAGISVIEFHKKPV